MALPCLPSKYVLTSLVLLLLFLATQPLAVANAATAPGRNAARCVALSTGCTYMVSKNSGVCHANKASMSQPWTCKKQACDWCLQYIPLFMLYPCSASSLRHICRSFGFNPRHGNQGTGPASKPSAASSPMKSKTPRPSPSNKSKRISAPSPTPSKSTNSNNKHMNNNNNNSKNNNNGKAVPSRFPNTCTWTGTGDNVVIDLGRLSLPSYWYSVRREGNYGMIYRNGPIHGISKPGMYGRMCFNIKAPKSGKYYFSAISYAPHNTEHNDVWVQSPSKGFELWKWGTKDSDVGLHRWLKAYQNYGTRGISDDLKTIDFNGHRFLIPGVIKNQTFRVCLSGRSKLYEIYRLVLVKCKGLYCVGGIMEGLEHLNPSACKF